MNTMKALDKINTFWKVKLEQPRKHNKFKGKIIERKQESEIMKSERQILETYYSKNSIFRKNRQRKLKKTL